MRLAVLSIAGCAAGPTAHRFTFALADAVAELEGGADKVVTSSGPAAVTMALTTFLNSGNHLLMGADRVKNRSY
jgi:cystathionine beta-lyase/cystathionine gamma-synthase